jgi:hypothetical protein
MKDYLVKNRIIMEWEFILHTDDKYVEVITHGVADINGSMKMAQEISTTMKQHRFVNALIDHRNIIEVSGSVADVYERPKFFRLIGVILGIKIAELIKPDHSKHFKFFETVCVNRGFKFSVFYEKEDALKWLIG